MHADTAVGNLGKEGRSKGDGETIIRAAKIGDFEVQTAVQAGNTAAGFLKPSRLGHIDEEHVGDEVLSGFALFDDDIVEAKLEPIGRELFIGKRVRRGAAH